MNYIKYSIQKNSIKWPLIIAGSTCSGKSALAENIAEKYDAEIINADSMQLYKDLKILTARPNNDEKMHLYGFLERNENFNANIWSKKVLEILNTNNKKIIVGGTGFYINALTLGLSDIPMISETTKKYIRSLDIIKMNEILREKDPKLSIHPNHKSRISRALEVLVETGKSILSFQGRRKKLLNDYGFILIKRNNLHSNIDERVIEMVKNGAIDEVILIKDNPCILKNAIGVTEIINFLNNLNNLNETIYLIQTKTKQYAKKQETWFKSQLKHIQDIQNFQNE